VAISDVVDEVSEGVLEGVRIGAALDAKQARSHGQAHVKGTSPDDTGTVITLDEGDILEIERRTPTIRDANQPAYLARAPVDDGLLVDELDLVGPGPGAHFA
jgi:hypothetical protein